MKPNLVERLEELLTMLDDARNAVLEQGQEHDDPDGNLHTASTAIDNAYGVAGEILTMVDGR